ncbi:MAG: SDR family oxidoreductase [Myxococcales bacterium]|nr:SDR family oxidoreductase [Myxococcales bacterium]
MSLYAKLARSGPSGFGYGSTADDVTAGVDLTGKRVLITGCNSGIGFESMRVLASRGAQVLGVARSQEKAEEACRKAGGDCQPCVAELSEPETIRALVRQLNDRGEKLDVIMLNAGIMALPKLQTAYGYELQFFTNHIGHFLLGTGILPLLADSGRFVVLSSLAHRQAPSVGIDFANLDGSRGYNPWRFYGQSKLANLLFARELGRRFAGTRRVATAVHPGVIQTALGRHMGSLGDVFFAVAGPLALKSIPQGAATQCWAAAHPDGAQLNGQYLSDCNVGKTTRQGESAELAARLWEESEKIVARWR